MESKIQYKPFNMLFIRKKVRIRKKIVSSNNLPVGEKESGRGLNQNVDCHSQFHSLSNNIHVLGDFENNNRSYK